MRPSRDEVYIKMATLIAERSTCARRDVGCILVNKEGHVLATGYNGVPAGMKHCKDAFLDEHKCSSADAKSGKDLDSCRAIHAEQNALLQCKDVTEIETCYSTTQPCVHCIKLLLNTSCKRIVYIDKYPHHLAEQMWSDAGREMMQISSNKCANCDDCKDEAGAQ